MLRSAQGYSYVQTEVCFLIKTTDKYWYRKFSVSKQSLEQSAPTGRRNIHTVIAAILHKLFSHSSIYYSSQHEKLN
jgi:hypothetical protein